MRPGTQACSGRYDPGCDAAEEEAHFFFSTVSTYSGGGSQDRSWVTKRSYYPVDNLYLQQNELTGALHTFLLLQSSVKILSILLRKLKLKATSNSVSRACVKIQDGIRI